MQLEVYPVVARGVEGAENEPVEPSATIEATRTCQRRIPDDACSARSATASVTQKTPRLRRATTSSTRPRGVKASSMLAKLFRCSASKMAKMGGRDELGCQRRAAAGVQGHRTGVGEAPLGAEDAQRRVLDDTDGEEVNERQEPGEELHEQGPFAVLPTSKCSTTASRTPLTAKEVPRKARGFSRFSPRSQPVANRPGGRWKAVAVRMKLRISRAVSRTASWNQGGERSSVTEKGYAQSGEARLGGVGASVEIPTAVAGGTARRYLPGRRAPGGAQWSDPCSSGDHEASSPVVHLVALSVPCCRVRQHVFQRQRPERRRRW